ncbi:oligosaccharide flippase family protein [Bacillus cereus]
MQFILQFTRYGMPMLGWFLGTSILQMVDRYMLQVYRSSVEVGIYSANSTLVTMSLGLICAPVLLTLHPIIMSKAAKSDKDELAGVITRGSQIFLLIVTPITIYITLYRYDIVGILLGEAYRVGADIVPVTMIGYFLWNIAMFGHKGHEIYKKQKVC